MSTIVRWTSAYRPIDSEGRALEKHFQPVGRIPVASFDPELMQSSTRVRLFILYFPRSRQRKVRETVEPEARKSWHVDTLPMTCGLLSKLWIRRCSKRRGASATVTWRYISSKIPRRKLSSLPQKTFTILFSPKRSGAGVSETSWPRTLELMKIVILRACQFRGDFVEWKIRNRKVHGLSLSTQKRRLISREIHNYYTSDRAFTCNLFRYSVRGILFIYFLFESTKLTDYRSLRSFCSNFT